MALSLTAGVMGEGWEDSMSTPRTDHLPPQVLKYLCSLSRPQFSTPPVFMVNAGCGRNYVKSLWMKGLH